MIENFFSKNLLFGCLFLHLNTSCQLDQYEPAYELAQGCFKIQSAPGHYLKLGNSLNPHTTKDVDAAESFYLQSTDLGKFLIYSQDERFLVQKHNKVTTQTKAKKNAEWSIVKAPLHSFSEEKHSYVILGNQKKTYLNTNAKKLEMNPADKLPGESGFYLFYPQPKKQCQVFPEAGLSAHLQPNQPPSVSSSIVDGFVDLHTHIAFPKTMAGLTMAGEVFHPYGIEHALGDCKHIHGKNGKRDLLEAHHSSKNGHQTAGYPHLTYWPNRRASTHIQAYYKWLERAHMAGLKILVTHVTGNPAFCQLLSTLNRPKAQGGCSAFDAVRQQTAYLYKLQDYIDAQHGGPGKGWFQIARNSRQARNIITSEKMAVVLGVEHGDLFSCNRDGASCTDTDIKKYVEDLFQMGIRSAFPIHRFDNAYGGTKPKGGVDGAWMHLTGRMNNSKIDHYTDLLMPHKLLFQPIDGYFWDIESCPKGVQGTMGITNMQDFMENKFLVAELKSFPKIASFIKAGIDRTFIDKLRPLPTFVEFQGQTPACNRRGLQPLGKTLIGELIRKGMLIEIDHLSYPTLLATLDILEDQQYSGFISSHGWIESNSEIRSRIFKLGGMLGVSLTSPNRFAKEMKNQKKEMESFGLFHGIGLGTDIQGLATQPKADPETHINYPFLSSDKKVVFTKPSTGNRKFDFKKEGLAHYGLLPEYIESLRTQGHQEAITSIMKSAETYLQMWEKAEKRAQEL